MFNNISNTAHHFFVVYNPVCLCPHKSFYFKQILGCYRYLAEIAENPKQHAPCLRVIKVGKLI